MTDQDATGGPLGDGYRPLRDLVAERLRRRIVTGELEAGARLNERKLAAELAVSRNPVREAIRTLEAAGLVEVLPRRGAFVATPDADRIAELMSIRRVLEGHAAGLAAQHHTASELEELRATLDRGEAASYRGDHLRAASAHDEFHRLVDDMSHNPYISLATRPLRERTELVFSLLVDARADVQWSGHEQIFAAVEARDPEAAEAAVVDHVEAVLGAFLEQRAAKREVRRKRLSSGHVARSGIPER